jgi:hypothetical protein
MPGPARRTGDGAESFARAVGRVACAQVVYAQAERLAEGAAASKPGGPAAGLAPRGTPKGKSSGAAADVLVPSAVYSSESVADALADIAAAFITLVGRRSAARAELGGRTSAALTDVLACLEDLEPVTQSNVGDLARYVNLEEIVFPTEVPPFPAAVEQAGDGAAHCSPDPVDGTAGAPGGADVAALKTASRPWIEPWMPPLPPSRTYKSTPGVLLGAGEGLTRPDRALLSTQRRQVEQSLARLKEKEHAGGGAGHVLGHAAASRVLSENPFLAPPRVGSARIIDEDCDVLRVREPTEPAAKPDVDDEADAGMRDSNVGLGEASDPKRARVNRIFTEARGTGGAGGWGSGAAARGPPAAAKKDVKGDSTMDVDFES